MHQKWPLTFCLSWSVVHTVAAMKGEPGHSANTHTHREAIELMYFYLILYLDIVVSLTLTHKHTHTLFCNTTHFPQDRWRVIYTRRIYYIYLSIALCLISTLAQQNPFNLQPQEMEDQSFDPPPLNTHTLPEGVKKTLLKSPCTLSLSSSPQRLFVLQPLGHQHDNTSGPMGPVCVSVCVCVK